MTANQNVDPWVYQQQYNREQAALQYNPGANPGSVQARIDRSLARRQETDTVDQSAVDWDAERKALQAHLLALAF